MSKTSKTPKKDISNDTSKTDEEISQNTSAMTTLEKVKYYFEELGFTNENPHDLELVAELHERWLRKDDSELPKDLWVLSQDPDVIEVLKRCRNTNEPQRRLTKTDLKILLEKIAKGEVERKDYVGKDAELVYLTPNFNERLNAIKMLMAEAEGDGQERIYFVDDIEAKYMEMAEKEGGANDTKET